MPLLLDTSIVVELERKNEEIIKKIADLYQLHEGKASVSFITHFEVLLGIKKRSPKNQAEGVLFLNNFLCLPATQGTASILSDLKLKYDKKGVSISLANLIIASQARENNLLLVTMDKTFGKIGEIEVIVI